MKAVVKPALSIQKGSRLLGKVALVTGIGSGIGRGCAMLFAAQGAQVVGCDIDAVAANRTIEEARATGLTIESLHPCDLTDPRGAADLVDFAVARHGGFDILVNAAAFGAFAWLEQMDYQTQWRKTLTGELDIVFLLCQAAWPALIARGGGSVINFASANAAVALEGSPAIAHCAGKGGVLAMTRQLAMEGAPHGIRVNSISPALVETAATRAHIAAQPEFLERALAKAMVKRTGQPEDIAWCALYLGSDESSWVTAANLPIDGGATAW
ncbi:SDR family NAD(P)-dependent oxidoreductase [Burkholderia multivorans]|uniref:SDR family NAD(P)-dependent oxidoreductase n=1 Tax=Burkholderia multivorans TaxID=87883 RepID=UPI001C2539BD|nr:SDR family NAD(P)-dependent oxidoreductase [Burkholderia multivorans]MBU9598396.1 SDR family oxidoreductase [Burkholderia multivorans]